MKHAFYTKERRFCSRACARTSEHSAVQAELSNSFANSIDQKPTVTSAPKDVKPVIKVKLIFNNFYYLFILYVFIKIISFTKKSK